MVSIILQILGLQPQTSKVFLDHKNNLKNNAFYLLILDVSQIQYSNIRTIQIQIEKNIYKPKIKD